jgi:propionate CoA-transferase
MDFSERKIIGCRALREISRGAIVNLGIGLPEAVAAVAGEENRLDDFTLTVEAEPIGGMSASGLKDGNVSRFAGRVAGVGGFLNISQNAQTVVFCCTFRAGGLHIEAYNGAALGHEGAHCKFVEKIEAVCFNGKAALQRGQRVLYVTERAVFALTPDGLQLVEVAPGIDVKTQVLDQMQFAPRVAQVAEMDAALFNF